MKQLILILSVGLLSYCNIEAQYPPGTVPGAFPKYNGGQLTPAEEKQFVRDLEATFAYQQVLENEKRENATAEKERIIQLIDLAEANAVIGIAIGRYLVALISLGVLLASVWRIRRDASMMWDHCSFDRTTLCIKIILLSLVVQVLYDLVSAFCLIYVVRLFFYGTFGHGISSWVLRQLTASCVGFFGYFLSGTIVGFGVAKNKVGNALLVAIITIAGNVAVFFFSRQLTNNDALYLVHSILAIPLSVAGALVVGQTLGSASNSAATLSSSASSC